jgi:hypothetical protein
VRTKRRQSKKKRRRKRNSKNFSWLPLLIMITAAYYGR